MALLLFDIDGTLISSPEFLNVYSGQLASGILKHFKRDITVDFSGLHGNTERKNLKILFERQGLEFTEDQLDDFFEEFGNAYQSEEGHLNVLPYVSETIETLSKVNTLGLVTGNQEIVARKRIAKVALDQYFSCGGFGNERYERNLLIALAIDRAVDNGWGDNRKMIYSIGDTPRDIEAGKIAGIKTVGVATGSYTQEQLAYSNPDYLIKNVSELESILK